MKQITYFGTFVSQNSGHEYSISVRAFSVFEAFFLLTAQAISQGRHYQLNNIQWKDVHAQWCEATVDNIEEISKLIHIQ